MIPNFVHNPGSPQLLTLIFLVFIPGTSTWHDLTNTEFHCWPLSASAINSVPYPNCPGIEIHWIVAPPDEIKAYVAFNVSYEINLDITFYSWAVDASRDIFNGITNATVAQEWCETTACPATAATATKDNCCIHHVNVHTCPLSQTNVLDNSLCGPWIPSNGDIFTHSEVMHGTSLAGNWTSTVSGLYEEGKTSMIAHFKLAGMHVALEKEILVLPRTVCGDGVCEADFAEDCSTCPKDCGVCSLLSWQIALIVVAILILVFIIVGIIGYFQWQKRKLLWDESWIIPFESIKEDRSCGAWGSRVGSIISYKSNHSNTTTNCIAQMAHQRQIFTKTGIVSGRTVAIKEIYKTQFSLTKTIRVEVKEVRELDHQNLCRFIGGCIEVPSVSLITEYCPKGCLGDVLMNEDVPLSWAFRFSFATDIARGMAYLHGKRTFHGRLKSNNCVVDDRWTVKITDYCLESYRSADSNVKSDDEDLKIYDEKRRRVYLAPEIKSGLSEFTAAADVYAFAIILIEVATGNGPYGDEDPSLVKDDWKPPLPDIAKHKGMSTCPSPSEYLKLVSACWDFHPHNRPTFDVAKKSLHQMNPDKMSPVDIMMNMMEKYSKHLEVIVAERTQDLVAEKQKTDRLLYSMLPRAVADELRHGRSISAEIYPECTIFFSDIVGFTTLSGSSTPIQVVELLNKLYTCFDSIIDEYNVYKIETIGDAYMVVSGVPSATPLHSKEITNMAIELVSVSRTFIIPHKPKEPLQIRVGLHTGQVCAGVVGLKMPRYCLFGDTVNTASRMESNGEAYKIHASNSTYESLCKHGGFQFEPRGAMQIKGKGEMKTWWVTGKILNTKDQKEFEAEQYNKTANDNEQHRFIKNVPEIVEIPGSVKDDSGT